MHEPLKATASANHPTNTITTTAHRFNRSTFVRANTAVRPFPLALPFPHHLWSHHHTNNEYSNAQQTETRHARHDTTARMTNAMGEEVRSVLQRIESMKWSRSDKHTKKCMLCVRMSVCVHFLSSVRRLRVCVCLMIVMNSYEYADDPRPAPPRSKGCVCVVCACGLFLRGAGTRQDFHTRFARWSLFAFVCVRVCVLCVCQIKCRSCPLRHDRTGKARTHGAFKVNGVL